MSQRIDHFKDVHEHATAVREWSQTYSQLSAGALTSSLEQIENPRFHVFRERINQRVVQHGEAPRDRVCFAVPLSIPGSVRMQGREADDKCIFNLRGGEEFMFHMPTGMDMLAITFDRQVFDRALSRSPWHKEVSSLLKQPVIQIPRQRLEQGRQRLLAMFDQTLDLPQLANPTDREFMLEQAMLEELIQMMTDPNCNHAQSMGSSVRSFIVEKCHRMTLSDSNNAPSVENLCERLRVSRRTMQNSFRSVAETTPVNYIRSIRLNGVRRELTSTATTELSIGDAAARWGFYHLSHFASDYQDLFGELPSHTRRSERVVGTRGVRNLNAA